MRRKNKLLAAIGVPLLTLFSAASSLTASAQQLPNNGFENNWAKTSPWTSDGTKEIDGLSPNSWTIAHVVGYKLTMFGKTSWMGTTLVSERVTGYESTYAPKLKNVSNSVVSTQIVPGYITLGTPFNTANTSGSNKDGGSFGGIEFAYRPDAISFQYQREQASGSTEPATVVVYSWKGNVTQANVRGNIGSSAKTVTMTNRDRNILGIETTYGDTPNYSSDFVRVAKVNHAITAATSEWTYAEIPLQYESPETPEKINVIFSAGDYFSINPEKDNTLSVDDVKLLYYSRLASATVGEQLITFEDGKYDGYSFDGYIHEIDLDEVENSCDKIGQSKSATVEASIDEATCQLKIKVSNVDKDIDNLTEHTYTIQCKPYVGSRLASVAIGKTTYTFDADNSTYNFSHDDYLTGIDTAAVRRSCVLLDKNNPAKIEVTKDEDKTLLIITVTGRENGLDTDQESEHIYTFDCKPYVCSRLKSIEVDGHKYDFTNDVSATGIFEYNHPGFLKDIHLDEVEATYTLINGNEATSVVVEKNILENQLEITVKGNDACGHAEHKYIIHCADYVALQSIQFDKPEGYELTVGSEIILTAANLSFKPADATEKEFDFTWEDGPDYATEVLNHDDGSLSLTGKKPGKFTVTATSKADAGVKATVEVTVVPKVIRPVAINDVELAKYIYLGETNEFEIPVTYKRAEGEEHEPLTVAITKEWASSNEAVIKVNDGKLTFTDNIDEPEEVTVTVKATFEGADGEPQTLSKEWKFTVLQPIKTLEWVDEKGEEQDRVNIIKGESEVFKVVFTPTNAIDTDVTYTVKPATEGGEIILSYNPENGMVTTTGTGTNSIVATVKNYSDIDKTRTPHEAELEVIVSEADAPVVYPVDITGTFPSSVLYAGETTTFTITPKYIAENPDETVNAEISAKWESLNPGLLTVVNNRVSMVTNITKPGSATVRLTATYKDADGNTRAITKTWEFEVRLPVKSIEWQNAAGNAVSTINVKDNETSAITAVVNPAYTTDKTLKIEVSGPIEYTDGKIVPTGAGTGTLTASVENYSGEEGSTRQPIVSTLTVNVEGLIRPSVIAESKELPKVLYIGETNSQTFTIAPKYTDADGNPANVKITEVWESGNADVLTVANGRVTMRSNAVVPEGGKTTVKLKASYLLVDGTTRTLEKVWEFEVRRPVTSVQWQDKNGNPITALTVDENQTADVKAVIRPATATDKAIEYEIVAEDGKEPVITYSNGRLTATGQGTNTVIARSMNFSNEDESRKAIEARLVVTVVAPTPVTIRPKAIALADGAVLPEIVYMGETQKFSIPVKYVPEVDGAAVNAAITETWSSSNTGVVKVSKGELTVGKALTAAADNVTVKLKATFAGADGKSKSIEKSWTFAVRQPVTDIEWQDVNGKALKSLSLAENAEMNLAAVIKPATATEKAVEFEIRGKEKSPVISYDNGVIKALGRGEAVLVARVNNFADEDNSRTPLEREIAVTVSAMKRSVAITEAGGNSEFRVGKTYRFEAEFTPAYEEPVELTWTSSDTEVATIASDGTLTALTAGTTTITVADPDGNKATYMVEVQDFPAINVEIPGYLTVTAPDGTSTTMISTMSLATTSWTTLNLSLTDVSVNGFSIGTIVMDDVEYAGNTDGLAGNAFVQLLASKGPASVEIDGGITVSAAIAAGTESYVDMLDKPVIAEVHFDLGVNTQSGSTKAVFSTTMPAGFDDPGKPEAGTTVDYQGSLTLKVVSATRSRAQEAETFTVDATLKITYRTEPDADGWFTADIEVPALRFGTIDEENLAPGEEPDYRYSLASFVMDNVEALRKGNVITYSFDETEVESNGDGYYTAAIEGSVKDSGSADFTLSINDNNGVEVTGGFSNAQAQGELYKGFLSIEMAGSQLADNMPASVIIVPNEDGETATFLLPDFTLAGIGTLGDIRVENVNVTTDNNGTSTYEGFVKDMQLLGGGIVADVTLNGTIDAEGYADMTINVVWMGTPINVKFTGEHSGTTTGISAPDAADDAAIDGPVEYYTIGGIRVAAGQRLAPGFYIERRGNKARKILIR